MNLEVRGCRCCFCPAVIAVAGVALDAVKGDVGLLLLWHIDASHPERFGVDPVRRRMEQQAWASRN